MPLTVVVAKYKEDVSWTGELHDQNEYHIKVYDKEHDYPNVGREAETYLRFILENYDNIPEYTAFVQGHPFDHFEKHIFLSHLKNYKTCKSLITLFEGDLSTNITFSIGAQFIVQRENILYRPKWFYEKIYNVLVRENPQSYGLTNTKCLVCPWSLERLWLYIFDKNLHHRVFEEDDLIFKN